MSQQASMIFKGCICWVAAILITIVSFAMLKFYNLERKWQRKLKDEISRHKESLKYRWSMFLLTGSATLREGMESVLFLTGTSAGLSVKAVIIPGIVGIVAGSLLGVVVYYSGRTIKSLKWFFIISSGLLMIIAAGMVINGTGFFTYAGLFGVMYPYEWRPWSNRIVWDATSCCDPNTNEGWALLRALFGWQAEPTNLQCLYWGLYWVITVPLLIWKGYKGTLTDKHEAAVDDLKSFARHGMDGDLDTEESSITESKSFGKFTESSVAGTDLEAGGSSSEKDGSPRSHGSSSDAHTRTSDEVKADKEDGNRLKEGFTKKDWLAPAKGLVAKMPWNRKAGSQLHDVAGSHPEAGEDSFHAAAAAAETTAPHDRTSAQVDSNDASSLDGKAAATG